jgi:hypothetical protein
VRIHSSRARSHLDEPVRIGIGMAGGGDAADTTPWDLAVLVGAALMISTLVIVTWTQPVTVGLDGPTEVLTIHTGLSDATINFDIEHAPDCEDCTGVTVVLVEHDGEDAWDGIIPANAPTLVLLTDGDQGPESVGFNEAVPQGEYRVILDGEGTYLFEATVNRARPHEYVPALIGALLLVWGIWRKQLESEA